MRTVPTPLGRSFGHNLAYCRHRADLTQRELAARTKLHRSEVSLLERGLREPRLGTIAKLANALEISIDELLDGISWRPAIDSKGSFVLPNRPPPEPRRGRRKGKSKAKAKAKAKSKGK